MPMPITSSSSTRRSSAHWSRGSALDILLMVVVTLVSALAVIILAMRIGTYMKLGTLLMPYMLAYTAMMIALVIVVVMTLRPLPYLAAFIDEGRKRT